MMRRGIWKTYCLGKGRECGMLLLRNFSKEKTSSFNILNWQAEQEQARKRAKRELRDLLRKNESPKERFERLGSLMWAGLGFFLLLTSSYASSFKLTHEEKVKKLNGKREDYNEQLQALQEDEKKIKETIAKVIQEKYPKNTKEVQNKVNAIFEDRKWRINRDE